MGSPTARFGLPNLRLGAKLAAAAPGLELAGLATMPIPFLVKDANTRALEKMRKEDEERVRKGLPPLATMPILEQH